MTLKEVYEHEKFRLVNSFKTSLIESISQLNLDSSHPGYLASYNPTKNQLHFLIDQLDSIIPVRPFTNSDSLYRMVVYDIRNPQKWTLDTLAKNFKPQDLQGGPLGLPYKLSRLDSLGNTIDQYPLNKNQVKNPDISLTIPLGHLEKHLLIADFTFPLSLFLKIAGERIITFVFLFILIVCLIYSLYLQLKNEKRLRNNQEIFTHTLVHNLRRPVLNIKCQLENLLLDGNGGNDLSQDEAFEHCRHGSIKRWKISSIY